MARSLGRGILAFVLAPVLSPLIIMFQFGTLDWRLVSAALAVAYVAIAVCALPLFYLCYRVGWRRWWHYVIAGVVACSLFLVFDLISAPPSELDLGDLILWAWRYIVHAIVASFVFWAIAVWQPRARPTAATTGDP